MSIGEMPVCWTICVVPWTSIIIGRSSQGSKSEWLAEVNVDSTHRCLKSKIFPGLSPVLGQVPAVRLSHHYRATKKVQWTWSRDQETAFKKLKDLLTSENFLVHYNSKLPIGMSCDASNVGIIAVSFYRFSNGSERPVCNVSLDIDIDTEEL